MRLLYIISIPISMAAVLGGCAAGTTPAPAAPIPSSTSAPRPDVTRLLPSERLPASGAGAEAFELHSPAFAPGIAIPARHTCHGENLSPPLNWSGMPPETQSLALVVDDPDAVKVAGHVWDHWLLFNIPASTSSLSEGVPAQASLPDGSRQGRNSSKGLGYSGPCPPSGQTHSYVFTLYAADVVLDLEPGATKDEVMGALDGHILGKAQLVGQYTSP